MRDIRPINLGTKIVGRAVTVQTFAGDWAKPVEAIDMAGPGDVLVIYNGSNNIAPWGGLATLSSKNKGIEGVVVDGAVRDVDEIRAMKYPLFSSGITPNAGDPKGMGEINAEITCGGQWFGPATISWGMIAESWSYPRREPTRSREERKRSRRWKAGSMRKFGVERRYLRWQISRNGRRFDDKP